MLKDLIERFGRTAEKFRKKAVTQAADDLPMFGALRLEQNVALRIQTLRAMIEVR
ncbi:hypothetical protein RsS62_06250 [Rhizobium dioscoreae]|nr:hypothetical protein RsS62_06250 [Rhizobium dioscoreae]